MEYKLLRDGPERDLTAMCEGIIMMAGAQKDPLTVLAFVTLGGERHFLCDEAIVAWDGDTPAGISTIAPKGESGDGQAEIVGLFVLADYRRGGVGSELLTRALARIRERELGPARLNILTRSASALVKKLSPDILVGVEVRDQSHLSVF